MHTVGQGTKIMPAWQAGVPVIVFDSGVPGEDLLGLSFAHPEVARSIARNIDRMANRMEEEAQKKAGRMVRAEHPVGGCPETGTRCSICKEPQHATPSGPCCKNGHGGADPL